MSTRKLDKNRKRSFNTSKITAQQEIFIKAMQADPAMQPAAAARVAGYKSPGVAASKLLKKPHIRAEISKQLSERLERLEMNGDRLLQELAFCALRDPIDLCNESGQIELNDLSKLPERIRRCIDSIKVTERHDKEGNPITTTEIRLVSKASAIEMAMRHFGMFEKDNAQTSKVTLNWDQLMDGSEPPNNVIEI